MPIPLATTTIAVDRRPAGDEYEPGVYSELLTGVRAHIGDPSGVELTQMGAAERVDAILDCDTIDLAHDDRVRDLKTGETWQVAWVKQRRGLGLDHTKAGLLKVTDRISTTGAL